MSQVKNILRNMNTLIIVLNPTNIMKLIKQIRTTAKFKIIH